MQQISQEWWIGLDDSYHTRVDNGSLVLWRPGRTVWINIWNDHEAGTPRERLDRWVAERDVRANDLFNQQDGDLLRYGYLLEEDEEAGGERLGLYSYTVSPTSTVQMACYFDLKEDLGWAEAASQSLSSGRPDPAREVDEPIGKDGHLVLSSEKVIGPTREPVLFAYRERSANEQDSGWRFFHGDEDEAYTADPMNIALCPLSSLLSLDPTLRVVINRPAGTAWRRDSVVEPWRPLTDEDDDGPAWQ
jgi:hypothetical protein